MEFNHKPGFDGMQGSGAQAYSVEAPPTAYATTGVLPAPASSTSLPNYILRVMAIVLTLVSTVVMGAAKQTVTVVGVDNTTDLLITAAFQTKSTYSAAFVYFIVANTLVFVYSVVSLALTIASRAAAGVLLPFVIGDVAMVALLFSCNGAAAAISVVLEHGQRSLADWTKICDSFGGFCGRVNAAIVLSMVAAVVYVLLVVLGVVAHRK
ncbi:CASP-like protein 1E1 [Canna indica]|uniref:CASP-like protein n=1 Tax=Canna indica TaxID=4628 RepID=A0AAQ3KQ80_9LILI|nr:CASP-like protein 1E1 [Canna indica]